ncbi:hypothetical protein FRC07_013950 [Ceratobasidium sp. 392]|nr:hypothetical protein FRC07_013950 [Ceratobasidium sp. 392]
MLFTRVFAAALALLPATQALAVPVRPMLVRGLEVKHSISTRNATVPAKPMSLEDIVANARAHVSAIKSQLAQVNAEEDSSVYAKDAADELKDTFDSFMSDLKALKASNNAEPKNDTEENSTFSLSALPIVGDVYDLVKDVISVADQIQSIASSGNVLPGVAGILGTIVGAVPTAISLVTSIAAFF